jgi:hypothetical protein
MVRTTIAGKFSVTTRELVLSHDSVTREYGQEAGKLAIAGMRLRKRAPAKTILRALRPTASAG